MTQAKALCEIKSWDEKPYSQVEGGPKLTLSVVKHEFTGDLQGVGTLEYLMFYYNDQSTRFIGYEQVVGELAKRSGSFVLRHEGILENGVAKVTWSVVPGSGTGGLRGLQGQGELTAGSAAKAPCTLDYNFT